ncbi:hypothetical protein KsCSTR_37520 [Candidatus Kuenenia stuttgartiensis]|uniref:Uncharacterized protein n=1 Tax=Kuenenia stuttgartiensis TaxID=174633 RepID=Q1Q675_KUEST|nr:hypothetical protein KsCSTR_37520 [Candidatus Kuenenia stuttgartiensis]CAJ73070.1 unknown protein [Candidatus Kuenenia stuttgartiensis]
MHTIFVNCPDLFLSLLLMPLLISSGITTFIFEGYKFITTSIKKLYCFNFQWQRHCVGIALRKKSVSGVFPEDC